MLILLNLHFQLEQAFTPYIDNSVLIFTTNPAFVATSNVRVDIIDNVPDTVHANELHITSPTDTIRTDVLVPATGNDTLEIDVASGSLGPDRMNVASGQSIAPGRFLVTGQTADNNWDYC